MSYFSCVSAEDNRRYTEHEKREHMNSAERTIERLKQETERLKTRITELDGKLKAPNLMTAVFEHTAEGILITDAGNTIIAVNRAATEITGYSSEELIGLNPRTFKSDRHDAMYYQDMWGALLQKGNWQGEIWNRRKNGETYPQLLSITVMKDDAGNIQHHIAIFTDLSGTLLDGGRLEHLSNFDALTDIPNRFLFRDRLDQAMVRARHDGTWLAMLFIDLDRFRSVNDYYGHRVGDKLLQNAAKRLTMALDRASTLARLGVDQFAVLLTGLDSPLDAARNAVISAQRALAELSLPFIADSAEISITASIGIALYPRDSPQGDLTGDAEAAMRHAKLNGRNAYEFYSADMNAEAMEQLAIESQLHDALERDEFLLYYQPQLDLRNNSIRSVETLMRWKHSRQGLISPDRFIPVTEKTGMIVVLGEYMLRKALEQLAMWRRDGLGDIRMGFNLSAVQFRQTNVVEMIDRVLKDTGNSPESLEIELTESVLMDDTDRAAITLKQLKDLGVQLALDDFGTGYSSLSYLKRFPMDKLKIDKSFIQDVTLQPGDDAIVEAIIVLAKSLNMQVVAEGVETEAQMAFLRERHCDIVQGFLVGRPMPGNEIPPALTNQPIH